VFLNSRAGIYSINELIIGTLCVCVCVCVCVCARARARPCVNKITIRVYTLETVALKAQYLFVSKCHCATDETDDPVTDMCNEIYRVISFISTVKIEAACSSKSLVSTYRPTRWWTRRVLQRFLAILCLRSAYRHRDSRTSKAHCFN
jgi:hypothetical protein